MTIRRACRVVSAGLYDSSLAASSVGVMSHYTSCNISQERMREQEYDLERTQKDAMELSAVFDDIRKSTAERARSQSAEWMALAPR